MTQQKTGGCFIDKLQVSVYETNEALGKSAANEAAQVIKQAIHERGAANIILATGNSQLTFLASLAVHPDIHWSKVTVLHLDEYVDLDLNHPASFQRFLHTHIIERVGPQAFYAIRDHTNISPDQACRRYEQILQEHPADLCTLGIGENGHLAFNEPPDADFSDAQHVRVVHLNQASRQQQVNEGHFAHIADVPTHAITLTIPAIWKARRLLVMVPERRKAEAVTHTLGGPISPECPASILRQASHAHLFLDMHSASLVLDRLG